MSPEALLDEIVKRICRVADPDKIILFGSRARGGARADSDYDFLVIEPSSLPRYKRSRAIYAAVADLPAEVEVLVYTPQEVSQWREVPQAFVTTAVREGKVLYEREGGSA